ncbi:MAG: hypothetical protein NTW10_05220 [Bacteroidetes bacterium]|nr:hypothetical protein [Bacteroidota bacterium]
MKIPIVSLCFVIALVGIAMRLQAQISINTDGSPPDGSSMLDIKSTNGGVLIPRMTTGQRDGISSPAIGLVIFNTTTDCIEIYNSTGWWNLCAQHSLPTGVIASATPNPVCSGGTLTLTGSATGASGWSWTGPNGFTSSSQSPTRASMTVADAGVYTLTASNAAGPAAPVSTSSVAVSTSPPDAAGAISGTPNIMPAQSGVAYSIDAVAGATGYTWNYSGTGFTVVSGANTNSITADFSASATPGSITVIPANACGNGTISPDYPVTQNAYTCGGGYTYNEVNANGQIWLDRNLGANRVATASNDYFAYGSLYQWGRQGDGHQCLAWTSATAGTPVNGSTPTQCSGGGCGDALFVTGFCNWSNDIPALNTLWDYPKAGNDPCPTGYRVPTQSELITLNDWVTTNYGGSSSEFYASPVKMPVSGWRNYLTGNTDMMGNTGFYWSSTYQDDVYPYALTFSNGSSAVTSGYCKAFGMPVRCIAN